MNFLKRMHTVRRFSEPVLVKGYYSTPYEDLTLHMDVQTLEDMVVTAPDGAKSVQKLKAFSDSEILVESEAGRQKADRLWFQGKWFECRSCRLSDNTPLRHYTATFTECLDQDQEPPGGKGESADEPGGSEG